MSIETDLFYALCQKYREASPIQSGDAYDDIVAYVDAQLQSARQSAQEPVYQVCNMHNDNWRDYSKEDYDKYSNDIKVKTRILYTSPVTNSDAEMILNYCKSISEGEFADLYATGACEVADFIISKIISKP